ncbi:hypothetical protein JCM11491_000602 [Sporobolomyces phaffii]
MASDRPPSTSARPHRASLSAVPAVPTSENDHSTQKKKKRAQSLGGGPLEGLRKRTKLDTLRAEATMTIELSPSRADRRRAQPRRSILKSVGVVFDHPRVPVRRRSTATAHTTDLSGLSALTTTTETTRPPPSAVERYDDSDQSSSDDDDDDDPNGSLDMDITRMESTVAFDRDGKRVHRASHARRVSFAPAANVRHFTPDRPTAEAQTALAAKQAAAAAALELAERTGDTSFLSSSASNVSDGEDSDDDDDGDGVESEPSMEIAGDEVTLAFKGHFAGTQLPVSALLPDVGADADEDEDGTQAMDEVTSDLTSQVLLDQAQQQPNAVGSAVAAAADTSERPRPGSRFSTIARQEDDDDDEVMRSLGFAKGGKPRKSRVGLVQAQDDDDDSSDPEDEDEGGSDMDMATAVLSHTSDHGDDNDDDDDDEAESAQVSMQLVGATEAADDDQTIDMVEVTASYGSILSAPLPRRSLAPTSATVVRPSTTPPPLRARTPSKSPFRGGGYGTPTSSSRRRAAAAAASPLPSPRRVSVASVPPVRSRSRSASPNKQGGPFLPPSSLATATTTTAAAAAKQTPRTARTPSPGHGLRTSASPMKATTATRPRPSSSSLAAGRSPGGSLSLRGLMAAQQQQQQPTSDSAADRDRVQPSAALGRDETELNLTAATTTEFESSFDDATRDNDDNDEGEGEGGGPRPPASIEAFFDATGTEFVNDFVGRSGAFDLSSSRARRKSLAASAWGDDTKERAPPTFADRVVAGACQLLMHDLYRNDQRLLIERMQETRGEYNELDAYIASGEIPGVFKDWAAASDDDKVNLKNQFAQIKLHYLVAGQVEWKATRNENMQQVVNAMEQRLDELRHDRAELEQFDEIRANVPALEQRHAALQAELLAERRLEDELSSYTDDQRDELAQLHADIDEQEEQINGNRAKGIPGARPQFERVEQQLQKDRTVFETELEKEVAARERIVELEAALKDKRTKADLSRMNAEFDTLQRLHGWSLTEFTADLVRLRHVDELDVAFELDPAAASLAVVASELRLVDTKRWTTTLALDVTNSLVARIADRIGREIENGNRDPRSLLHVIAAQSVVVRHVRHEVAVAALAYPVHFSPTTESIELELYSHRARTAFVVSIPMHDVQLDEGGAGGSGGPLDSSSTTTTTVLTTTRWAEHLSADIQVKFGANLGSAGLAINERLNDGEGLVAALRAGEQTCLAAF